MKEQGTLTGTSKDTDAVISSEELASIEKEVLAKDKDREAELTKEVETKVRKDMQAETRLKELETEKAKLELLVKEQAKEKQTLNEDFRKEIDLIKEKIGSSKRMVDTDSPFGSPNHAQENPTKTLDSEKVREIDEESKTAFLKSQGITEKEWI